MTPTDEGDDQSATPGIAGLAAVFGGGVGAVESAGLALGESEVDAGAGRSGRVPTVHPHSKHDGPARRPSARFVTTAIVVATVAAALTGFLLDHASSRSSQAADQAQQLSLKASADSTLELDKAESDFFSYLQERSNLAKAAEAWWESALDNPEPQELSNLQTTYDNLANADSKSIPSDLHPFLANGNPDPNFPYSFFDSRTLPSEQLAAQADGQNDSSKTWGSLADTYTVVLTILAVALFLLGSAFVLLGRNRVFFCVVALALMAIAGGWTTIRTIAEPGPVSAVAANEYAAGVEELDNTDDSVQGAQIALQDFDIAIADRPDYADAFEQRADAEEAIGSLQVGGGFVSAVSPMWLKRELDDQQSAYNLGDRDADLLLGLGFDSYEYWVESGATGKPPLNAISIDQLATSVDPTDPVPWMNLGVALLADGQPGQAQLEYKQAMELILASASDQSDDVAGGLTDLDNLATSPAGTNNPTHLTQIANIKGFLALSLATGKPMDPKMSPVSVGSLDLQINPSHLQVAFSPPTGWNPGTGGKSLLNLPVTVAWYERSPSGGPWTSIAEALSWGSGNSSPLHFDSTQDVYYYGVNFTNVANQCLPEREYRADIYIDGEEVKSATIDPNPNGSNFELIKWRVHHAGSAIGSGPRCRSRGVRTARLGPATYLDCERSLIWNVATGRLSPLRNRDVIPVAEPQRGHRRVPALSTESADQ